MKHFKKLVMPLFHLCAKAEEAISDQVHFIASEAQWKALTKPSMRLLACSRN